MLFALAVFRFNWLETLDKKIYDVGLSGRRPLAEEPAVVVVAIDEQSRSTCFRPPVFPISAHVLEHAEVVDRLVAAGARVIAFDVLFDQLAPEVDPFLFAMAVSDAGNVILAAVIEKRSLALRSGDGTIQEERLAAPSDRVIPGGGGIGLVNMPIDSDMTIRRAYSGVVFQGVTIPSLPAAVAAACGVSRGGTGEGGDFYIDYKASDIVLIPYSEVLEGFGWERAVRGRPVLVGVTENSMTDVYSVPVAGLRGSAAATCLPGVIILAHAAATILSGSSVDAPVPWVSLLIAAGLALGSSVAALWRKLSISLGMALGLVVVVLGAGVCANALRITLLPVGKLMGVTVGTSAIGLAANYLQARLRSELQAEKLEEISVDMRAASEIQHKLQPERIPPVEGVEIAGLQVPCKEIGGDYYDVIPLEGGQVALLIADVSGKGVSAALLMSNLQSSVRSLARQPLSAKEMVEHLNRAACEVFSAGQFVTLFYGVLDPRGRSLAYCNAGHLSPLLSRADGTVARLERGGLPLGIFEAAAWDQSVVALAPGDLLVMYTDGLTEAARRRTRELLGEERVTGYLAAHAAEGAEAFNRGILEWARRFAGYVLDDDITLLTVRVC